MATQLISFPFRFTPNGFVATREDGDDDYYAEELALLLLTQPGERILVPTYGLSDPTFDQIDASMITAQIAVFGPPVEITTVDAKYTSDTTQDVKVTFKPIESDDPDTEDFNSITEDVTNA